MCSRNHRSLFRLSMGAIIQGIDASSLDVTLGAGAILVCFEGPTVLGVLGVSLPSAAGTEVVVAGMPSPEGRTDVDSVAAVGDSGADVDVSTEAPPACSLAPFALALPVPEQAADTFCFSELSCALVGEGSSAVPDFVWLVAVVAVFAWPFSSSHLEPRRD